MTKGFCKTGTAFLLASTVLCAAADSVAQSCAVAPTCESLGYTMATADCNGKKTLKCPFDTSKLYCVTEAGLANINLGDIVFSDHTTSSPSVFVNKTPIGIVVGKTSDSIIVARSSHDGHSTMFFSALDYPGSYIDSLTINKQNSDIDTITWESQNYGKYIGLALPRAILDEVTEALAAYDGKNLYSFFIDKFFSNKIYTSTLDEFGFYDGLSICAQKGRASYCPELLLPQEISVKWKIYSDGDQSGFLYCNNVQTDGTAKGDWYPPTSKDLTGISDAIVTFYQATNGISWQHPYYNSLSQEIKNFKDLKDNPTYVFTLDKALIRDSKDGVTADLHYSKAGVTPDKYLNIFSYKYPYRQVKYNSAGRMICITKIKI